jgi:ribosome-associated translation inhibitor RaiA
MFEKFKFRKFNPTQDVAIYANTMLSQVMDMAPADSTCIATMARVGNNYLSSLEIASSSGQFRAESKAQDPMVCIDILDERIKQRIKDWKNNRNDNSSNGSDWFFPDLFSREPSYA